MRQITLYKPLGPVIKLFFLAIAFTSCKKQNSDVTTPANPETISTSKGGPAPTYPEVPLRMTVNDAVENKITSDGLGEFVNGTQNVKVMFDKYGNFIFNTRASNNPNVPMVRRLNYNFNSPISSNPLVTGIETGSYITGGKSATSSGYTPLQDLVVGTTQCIAFSAGLINFDPKVVNFHSNWEDVPNTPTAFAYVSRMSQNQWVISPVPPLGGGCSSISNVTAFVTNGGALVWYYHMPYSFTLTSL
jgi:hypothetical protein